MRRAPRFDVRLVFEPRDLWIGAYVKLADGKRDTVHRVYVCLIPMFPIIVSWWMRAAREAVNAEA